MDISADRCHNILTSSEFREATEMLMPINLHKAAKRKEHKGRIGS